MKPSIKKKICGGLRSEFKSGNNNISFPHASGNSQRSVARRT
jgi:hypothetical protein